MSSRGGRRPLPVSRESVTSANNKITHYRQDPLPIEYLMEKEVYKREREREHTGTHGRIDVYSYREEGRPVTPNDRFPEEVPFLHDDATLTCTFLFLGCSLQPS